MKKRYIALSMILSSIILSGCGGCKNLNEDKCKHTDKCISTYKPCSSSVPGCKENILFVQCKDKRPKN